MKTSDKIYACNYCHDTGLIQQYESIITCTNCIHIQRYMEDLKRSIKRSEHIGDIDECNKLTNIASHLPKYAVMAYYEAVECNMSEHFLQSLKKVFDLRV